MPLLESPRILVVSPSWVGDAVMAQSLLRRLKAHWPQATIDLLAPAWTAGLLERMPEVAQVLDNPFGHGSAHLRERFRLGRSLASNAYERAYILPNSLKSALVPFFARIPIRVGYVGELRYGLLTDARKLNKSALPRMVERFAWLADAADAPLGDVPDPVLQVSPAMQQAALAALGLKADRPVAAFCVGAEYGPAKRWPPEHFSRLAALLPNHQIWLMGSAKDAPLAEAVIAQGGANLINLCGRTTLGQAIDLLSLAQLVVANDSGLMHVAAALQRPLVALYGSSSPVFTPPLGANARIVSINAPCSPCFQRECPLGHFRCMQDLDATMVHRAAMDILPG